MFTAVVLASTRYFSVELLNEPIFWTLAGVIALVLVQAYRTIRRMKSMQSCVYPAEYETFDESVTVRSLPIIAFNDEATEQHVWYDGTVIRGSVGQLDCDADVRARNPVVMSPSFLGFTVEPDEFRYLHFRGVGIVFARPDHGRFMQPSIDTILLCRALSTLFEDKNLNFRSLIDIGSGSGFLGKFAATYAPGSADLSATLVDIDGAALEYARTEYFGAPSSRSNGRKVDWKFHDGDAVKLLQENTGYDLLVSNPPYIPTKEEVNELAGSAMVPSFWEGCGLLCQIVAQILERRCPANAHLVLGLSSLSLKSQRLCSLLEEAPRRGVRVRVLLEREVAWKAWYAGRGSAPDFLIASGDEASTRRKIGDCEFFVGCTKPGASRLGGERDDWYTYHWHHAYVLDISAAPQA